MVRGLLWVSAAEGMDQCERRRAFDARGDARECCVLCGEVPDEGTGRVEAGGLEEVQLVEECEAAAGDGAGIPVHHE